jgi:ATP-dependent exoDNAse (exonuclease V) beta subunit
MMLTGSDPMSADLTDTEGEAERLFPEGFRRFIEKIRQMTLFESVENIILFFRLGENPGNSAYLNSFQDCVLEFSGLFSADIPSFLEWWENTGTKKSVVVSDQQNSMRVLTIHKSKGLEFSVVIIPFISWSMGHGSSSPALWVTPEGQPFRKLGVVPVKYKADLRYSDFDDDYFNETYNTLVDNINLLYVAFTRAVDCLNGFCPMNGRSGTISKALYEAIMAEDPEILSGSEIDLRHLFDTEKNLFSFGEADENHKKKHPSEEGRITSGGYYVNHGIARLHLKFHGDNWLQNADDERKKMINYGLLMHEILETVLTADDVPDAVRNMLLQGRITENERSSIEKKIIEAMARPEVKDWFSPGLKVMNESEILSPDGTAKRPDRVVITDEKVIVIDFKFGKEKGAYLKQVIDYKKLLDSMEAKPVEAYLWYVDNNNIIKV